MNKKAMNKMMRLILCTVLIAAMALMAVGCGSKSAETTASGVSFTFVVTDLEGNESTFDITTSKATVGEALLDEGLIAGENSEYGLYVTSVNGMTADWDNDQTYWAFYIDGEYAMTGVDATEVTEGATYSFVLTKG
ncbi:MAG: DUF4430 domain-containing protein [Candidatus Faecousia sp.]|nr:DUF4430 domain-containing protein [Clostridiales bacterium]MDY6179553.1 DUF4430 domain-containing protein [Candidatus Faecousia sp.]